MKRFLVSLTLFVLLAGLLTMGGSRPTLAQGPPEPQVPPGIPRHRVGHRAKVDNLDVLLEQGTVSDPLAGNYTLVDWDEIVLAWEGGGDKFNVKMYDVNANLDNPTAKDKQICPEGYCWLDGVHGDNHLDVATGDFNGDGRVDIVTVWESKNHLIQSRVLDASTRLRFLNSSGGWTGETAHGRSYIRLATGDFDEDGQDEIVMAWEGGDDWVNLKVFDTQGGLSLYDRGKIHDETVGGDLDVATGDFDGDGDDEVILVWTGEGGTNEWQKVYDVDRNGQLYAKARLQDGTLHGGKHLAVATGDFNGDGVDEFVVGREGGDLKANLKIYQVTDNLDRLVPKGHNVESAHGVHGDSYVSVATGDFNTDGTDEIVFAYEGKNDEIVVRVFASDSELNLRHKSEIVDETVGGDLAVAVGDMNRDTRAEIALAWTGESGTNLWTKVYQVTSTDLRQIEGKGRRQDEELHGARHLAVAVGNFDGDSIRIGPPRHWAVSDVEQTLAVIKAPPQHYDVISDTTHTINFFDNIRYESYATYEMVSNERTQMSLTTTRDWGVSAGLEYTLGDEKVSYVKGSLKASYGEGFKGTTIKFEDMTFGTRTRVTTDDIIILITTTYDVWEYPVYAEASDQVAGHLLVVFPRSPGAKSTLPGRDPLSYYFYKPPNEPRNLLSYSQWVPPDYEDLNLIKGGNRYSLGTAADDFWVDWSTGEIDETERSSHLKLSAGVETKFGALGGNLKINVDGSYGEGEISTHKVSFQDNTKVRVHLGPLENEIYAYWVEPYVYWSADAGYLVLDYAAGPKSVQDGAPLDTWWDDTYNKPDPTFNLPWKYREPGGSWRLLTKGISFEPDSPMEGDTVTIRAMVRNYSLVSADNVTVRFYVGDPDDGGVQIGEDQSIQHLGSVLAVPPEEGPGAEVSVEFDILGYGGQPLKIYAVVDPDDEIAEMHEDYNKAYAILPVKVPGAPPLGPINLEISPEDIIFDPETPALGETVHISATVEAMGDTFTFVPVEFWDGDPRRGGELIGGEVIPMIMAGQTATASITWDTAGKYGSHDIWVGIDYDAGEEDISTDNWAYKTLNLPPFRLWLPLLLKDVQ